MKAILCVLLLCGTAWADKSSHANVEDLKMNKRFGLGVSAGGPLSVMGLEADVNITAEWSLSVGLGTGIDYGTFTVKNRFFLPGQWVSPYIGAGIARWWSGPTKEKHFSPSVLANRFLSGQSDFSRGFEVWMVYPCAGVQFMHWAGFGFYAEVQYLFKLVDFANGGYAGLGMHWYF